MKTVVVSSSPVVCRIMFHSALKGLANVSSDVDALTSCIAHKSLDQTYEST